MLGPIHVLEGLRMFKRARNVRIHGWKKYNGNAEEICSQIIEDCWNKRYFQTSAGHFCQFWTRDFAWCAEPLIRLGYQKEVKKTAQYALEIFKKHDKVTTTISPKDKPFDFPNYAVDSVPYFIRTLSIADPHLIKHNKKFLQSKVLDYFEKILDTNTGLVRKDKHFSSIKDYARRVSSCYGNCMVAMLGKDLNKILENPLPQFDFSKLVKEYFWKRDHFVDDLSGNDTVTGDANLFPFWTRVFDDKKMFERVLGKVQKNKLDRPFPLRYYHKRIKEHDMITVSVFASDYEHDTVWGHLGPLWIQTVKRYDEVLAQRYLDMYVKVIERHKNYLEVFYPDKRPYSTYFYHADEGMLWSALILDMIQNG